MSQSPRCPACDTELPIGTPPGMCPGCLLKAGLESQPAASGDPGPTAASPSPGFVPPTVAAIAAKFPQLEILELLGKGGMGAVYKARQPGLDRLVAVKILPPEVGHDPAFAERFMREARALARLSHPNIVAVYDFGQQAGLYYFAMEYVDGVNLRQAMNAQAVPASQALTLVGQICDALQYAHDEGIVHRDIKPENILLDKKGRVKIADFGLSKLLSEPQQEMALTGTHQVMGTLRYMAPEQMEGLKQVDHRADIYSLGVVFYELLTGEVPMGRFEPPSHRANVDARLDDVVLRSLAREPAKRYQQAGQVRSDVETIRNLPSAASLPAGIPAGMGPLLMVYGGMLFFSLLVVIAGLVCGGVAFATQPFGSNEFWGWMGGALGCTLGGLGSLAGCWNSYRQLAGAEDLMHSPRWTWLDRAMFVLAALGCVGIAASLAVGESASHETRQSLLVIGGMLTFQGSMLLLLRWAMRNAATERSDTREASLTASQRSPEQARRTVRAPAETLVLVAIVALVTAIGIGAWWLQAESFAGNRPFSSGMNQARFTLLGTAGTELLYSAAICAAGLAMRQLRARFLVLLGCVIFGVFLPAVLALNVIMEHKNMPGWQAIIPLWLGIPAALWAIATLYRSDVQEAFVDHSQAGIATGNSPPWLLQRLPITIAAVACGILASAWPIQWIERGFWGVDRSSVSSTPGVTISGITPGSPAAVAGMKDGDQLMTINGQKVGFYDISPIWKSLSIGSPVELQVVRRLPGPEVYPPPQETLNLKTIRSPNPIGGRMYMQWQLIYGIAFFVVGALVIATQPLGSTLLWRGALLALGFAVLVVCLFLVQWSLWTLVWQMLSLTDSADAYQYSWQRWLTALAALSLVGVGLAEIRAALAIRVNQPPAQKTNVHESKFIAAAPTHDADTFCRACGIMALVMLALGLLLPACLAGLLGTVYHAAVVVSFLGSLALCVVFGVLGRRHKSGRTAAWLALAIAFGAVAFQFLSQS